jgi:hypothetical protein
MGRRGAHDTVEWERNLRGGDSSWQWPMLFIGAVAMWSSAGGGGDSEVVPWGEEVGEGPNRRSATARSRH